jgi:hypothetical protein
MVEHFGERNPLGVVLVRILRLARKLQRIAALDMGADARVMAAKRVSEVTMTCDVVERYSVPRTLQRAGDIAAKKRRRQVAMMGFEQQLVIAGVLREPYEFASAIARQRGLAAQIGVDP